MSSTNKTTNYELSQYVGSDKPTYLGDYNSDMLKIDTQMKANATAVVNAQSTATTASETATTANSTANTANETANTASTTATSALNKSLANETAIAKFNLTNIKTISNFTVTGGRSIGGNSVQVATNSDGSIGKIYGHIYLDGSGAGNVSFATDLRPSENINVNGIMLRIITKSNNQVVIETKPISIATDGTVTCPYTWIDSSSNNVQLILMASIIFMSNFGDQPQPD